MYFGCSSNSSNLTYIKSPLKKGARINIFNKWVQLKNYDNNTLNFCSVGIKLIKFNGFHYFA